MSGILAKFSYKQLHAMKHALETHIQRENISDDDLKSEKVLLFKVNHLIGRMKEQHRI